MAKKVKKQVAKKGKVVKKAKRPAKTRTKSAKRRPAKASKKQTRRAAEAPRRKSPVPLTASADQVEGRPETAADRGKVECPVCGRDTDQILTCPVCDKEGCVEECIPGGVGTMCVTCEEGAEEELKAHKESTEGAADAELQAKAEEKGEAAADEDPDDAGGWDEEDEGGNTSDDPPKEDKSDW